MSLHSLRDRLLRSDRGLSLIEVIVTMVLLAVVGSLMVGAVSQSAKVFVNNSDENRGLQDAKVVLDRMGRDVRNARGVLCDGGLADPSDSTSSDTGCAAHLQLWIDSNSDYIQQNAEVITWRLRKSSDQTHFDVLRITGNGLAGNVPTTQVEATSLIVRTLFTYDTTTPSKATLVNLRMRYDAIVGAGTDIREAVFSARLRNKGA